MQRGFNVESFHFSNYYGTRVAMALTLFYKWEVRRHANSVESCDETGTVGTVAMI